MHYKQDCAISFLNEKSLKLANKFSYVDWNSSSTKNNVIICTGNIWAAINRLMPT